MAQSRCSVTMKWISICFGWIYKLSEGNLLKFQNFKHEAFLVDLGFKVPPTGKVIWSWNFM